MVMSLSLDGQVLSRTPEIHKKKLNPKVLNAKLIRKIIEFFLQKKKTSQNYVR